MPLRKPYNNPLMMVLTVTLLSLPACAARTLRGVVTDGQTPAVLVVKSDDPRLVHSGLAGAVIEMTLDPASMSPSTIGTFTTGDKGTFEALLEETGVGVLEYELGILCRAAGHRSVYQTMAVPRSDRRLLIVMVPGPATDAPPENLLEDAKRIGGHGTPYR